MQHRHQLPYPLELFTGAIGKQFVVKRTPRGKIITRYPDMSRITASAGQRKCRNLFKEAVVYAKAIIADTTQKTAWQKRLNKTRGIYQAVISAYMKKEKLAKAREEQLTARLIRGAMNPPSLVRTNLNPPNLPEGRSKISSPPNLPEGRSKISIEFRHHNPNTMGTSPQPLCEGDGLDFG